MSTGGGKGQVRFGSAVRWATVMNWGQEGLSALVTFALAMFVGPSDFGQVVMATSYTGFLELLVAQGFLGAIVQRKDLEDIDLDSVFWIVMLLGAALTLLGLVTGGLVAAFYHQDQLAPLVQVLSLSVLIRGLSVVQEAKLTREMNFKSLAVRTNLSVILSAVVAIGMAIAGYGVWALVGQSLTRSLTGLLVIWHAAGWRPRWRFHAQHIREMTAFSVKYFPATLFDFFGSTAEPLIMGRFFGDSAVGIYRLAMRLVDLLNTFVTRALWYVAFPYFSEAKGDIDKLRVRVTDCTRYAGLFAFPALAVLAIQSPQLADVFGKEWAAAAPVIRVLCIYGALRSLALFAGPLLFGLGRPQMHSAMMGLQCVSLCAGAGVAGFLFRDSDLSVQVSGTAWARVAVYAIVIVPIAFVVVVRNARMRLGALAAAVFPGVVVSLMAAAADRALMLLVEAAGLRGPIAVLIPPAMGGVAALAGLMAMDRTIRATVLRVLRPQSAPSLASTTPGQGD